jgi:hypothetical protein
MPLSESAKLLIEQFEAIRSTGSHNMYDRLAVQRAANEREFYGLASLDSDEYLDLLHMLDNNAEAAAYLGRLMTSG